MNHYNGVETDVKTYLRCQRDNLPPPLHSQIRTDDTTYPRAQHLPLVIQQHSRVVVEPHYASVWPANGLARAHDDSPSDVATAHLGRGRGCVRGSAYRARAFDDADNFIANGTVAIVHFVLEHVNTFDEECARVVQDLGASERRSELDFMLIMPA
jgi:hypothetical protein